MSTRSFSWRSSWLPFCLCAILVLLPLYPCQSESPEERQFRYCVNVMAIPILVVWGTWVVLDTARSAACHPVSLFTGGPKGGKEITRRVRGAVWAKDGAAIYYTERTGKIIKGIFRYDVSSRKCVRFRIPEIKCNPYSPSNEPLFDVAPNGQKVAINDWEGNIMVIPLLPSDDAKDQPHSPAVSDKDVRKINVAPQGKSEISAVCWLDNDRLLISEEKSQSIFLVQVPEMQVTNFLSGKLFCVSLDGRYLVYANNATFLLRNITRGTDTALSMSNISSNLPLFSSNQKVCLRRKDHPSTPGDARYAHYNTETGQYEAVTDDEARLYKDLLSYYNEVCPIGYAPDGKMLFAIMDNTVPNLSGGPFLYLIPAPLPPTAK